MKILTRLIASASSEEEIKNMIAQFFCNKPENYRISGLGPLWYKQSDGTETWMKSFRVIQKKDRFRFEAIIG